MSFTQSTPKIKAAVITAATMVCLLGTLYMTTPSFAAKMTPHVIKPNATRGLTLINGCVGTFNYGINLHPSEIIFSGTGSCGNVFGDQTITYIAYDYEPDINNYEETDSWSYYCPGAYVCHAPPVGSIVYDSAPGVKSMIKVFYSACVFDESDAKSLTLAIYQF